MVTERWARAARFLVVGGFNTAITYGMYLWLTLWLMPWLAYSCAYAFGIGIAFFGNRTWVFRSDRSWSSMAPYAIMQVALMVLGSLVSWLLTGVVPPWVVGIAAIAVVLPISFVANALFFRSSSSR